MEIKLLRGEMALIDDADYSLISTRKWRADYGAGHKRVARVSAGGHRTKVTMHELLMSPPKGMVVDHINGNPLDNRRANLRVCLPKENSLNVRMPPNKTSGVKGVTFYPQSAKNKWRARVLFNGKQVSGYFETIEQAKAFHREIGRKLHGEFYCP